MSAECIVNSDSVPALRLTVLGGEIEPPYRPPSLDGGLKNLNLLLAIVVLLICARVIKFIPRTPNQVHFWESCADLVLDLC